MNIRTDDGSLNFGLYKADINGKKKKPASHCLRAREPDGETIYIRDKRVIFHCSSCVIYFLHLNW